MTSFEEATFPPLYAPWLREIAGGPIPRETVATCDNCVMLPPEGSAPDPAFFLPGLKCCTFEPTIPNFLAGGLLVDSDPSMAQGRAALEERIARRAGVSPRGVHPSAVARLFYERTPGAFGRAPALRCPYLVDEGACGVWRHRPGVCATWFCKHVRGETAFRFWKLSDRLLRAVESDLAVWCAAEIDPGSDELPAPEPGRLAVSDLGGPVDPVAYRAAWGAWEGKERQLYIAAAELVGGLSWEGVLSISGPTVRVLSGLVREAAGKLTSESLPKRLRLGSVTLVQGSGGEMRVLAYSPYDPLALPVGLVDALRYFDGRPVDDAVAAIRRERNLALSPSLIRRMVDFGILESAD